VVAGSRAVASDHARATRAAAACGLRDGIPLLANTRVAWRLAAVGTDVTAVKTSPSHPSRPSLRAV